MLEYLPECLKTAGPLVIFGAFVLAFERRIVPGAEEIRQLEEEFRWVEERQWVKKTLFSILSVVIILLVTLGVCFGLFYAWIGCSWLLYIALGLMSAVSLILLSAAIFILSYQLIREYYISPRIEKAMEKTHRDE